MSDNAAVKLSAEAAGHPKMPPKVPRNLITLPQEIQDIIFDIAYPTVEGFQVVTKARWQEIEQQKWRTDRAAYAPRPFQAKVSEFLVSKQYFVCATSAFIGNQTFDIRREVDFTGPSQGGIIFQFMTAVILDTIDIMMKFSTFPPNLKSVTLAMKEPDFEVVEPKLAWEDDLDEEDFKAITNKNKYHRLSALHGFELEPDPCYYADTRKQVEKLKENVEKLEDFLWPIVSRPKDISCEDLKIQVVSHTAPLYLGSKVLFGTSHMAEDLSDERPRKRPRLMGFGGTSTRSELEMNTMGPLRLRDIPDDLNDLQLLVWYDGDRFLELIRGLKQKDVAGLL